MLRPLLFVALVVLAGFLILFGIALVQSDPMVRRIYACPRCHTSEWCNSPEVTDLTFECSRCQTRWVALGRPYRVWKHEVTLPGVATTATASP